MKTYILGYISHCSKELSIFKSRDIAIVESVKWKEVKANNLREAKDKFKKLRK